MLATLKIDIAMLCWFVYVLKSKIKDWMYVGFTHDLARRIGEHDAGRVKSTKAYRPLELVAYVAVATERKARELERYFKTGSGKAVLKRRILTDAVGPSLSAQMHRHC